VAGALRWRRDWALWIEFFVVTAVSVPVAQWSPVSDSIHSCLRDRRGDVYPAVVGLEGTILGFVLAALTIVLGYANSPRFEPLRQTRHWEAVFRAYTRAAKWTAVALVYGLVVLMFDTDSAPNSPLSLMLLLTSLLAAIRVARVLYITEGVVRVVIHARPRQPGQ
jgi:hypothetical protein